MALGPRCKICGKPYVFPDCELEALMYPRAGTKGPWERSPGEDDRAKFRNWTLAQVEQATAEGRQAGELGLNLILLGDKEGLRLLAPMLTGTVQQKWDFIVKRLVPFSFSLTHARPGGYETERIYKWFETNFDRLKWSDAKKAFTL